MTNSFISNSIDLDQESCCFGNQNSISAHPFELDQHQNFEKHVDILVCYPFYEIELEHECDLEPQIDKSIPLLDLMLTLVSLPQLKCFPKSALDHVPIHHEIELLILDSHLELNQYITSKSQIDKLVSFPFKDIKLRHERDFDPQICDPVQILESILTPVMLPQFEQHFRVSFGSHTFYSWTWITNLRKSHSIMGK